MKKLVLVFCVLVFSLVTTSTVSASRLGNQVGAEQDQAQVGTQKEVIDSPNTISGDGIPNRLQDEEYGQYGDGESPNEISGDGILNASQNVDFGNYGTASSANMQSREGNVNRNQERIEKEECEEEECETIQIREQNQIRSGGVTHTLGLVEQMGVQLGVPDIAQNIQRHSQTLKSNVAKVEKAEAKIAKQSAFARFFMGGDEDAANELKRIANENRAELQQMNRIMESCTQCDGEVKEQLREQIRMIEREQVRIESVAQREVEKKGLFGFLFGWIGE